MSTTPQPFRYPDAPKPAKPLAITAMGEGEWIAQPKHAGYRVLVAWDGSRATFTSREGKPIDVGPETAAATIEALMPFPGTTLDAEFTGRIDGLPEGIVAFDILRRGGKWLDQSPFDDRIHWLATMFPDTAPGGRFRRSEHTDRGYLAFYQATKGKPGLEGCVFKRRDSGLILATDRQRVNPGWVKIKHREGIPDRSPAKAQAKPATLVERFGIPPFSILDARQGYWKSRKDQWLALGIRSEIGRGEDLVYNIGCVGDAYKRPTKKSGLLMKSDSGRDPRYYAKKREAEAKLGRKISTKEFQAEHYSADVKEGATGLAASGTSVFDPVLCELSYRWFCPPGGTIIDPFAGGSVRGIIAAATGRKYMGVDLRPEQVEANREQWKIIGPKLAAPAAAADPATPTPIEQRGDAWVKRDDAFEYNGVRGGKVRTCLALSQGAKGLVTAGSRASPQVNIVAHIAQGLGIPCRVHTPTGALSPEVEAAQAAGAEVVQHKAGYNNVIVARAREDAKARGWANIPFGMECEEAISQTRRQVRDIPPGVKRIVMPAGSAMSLAGVLWGLQDIGRSIPIAAIVVGADPRPRLEAFAPPGWQDRVKLIHAGTDYHAPAPSTDWRGITLDPHYEAKCIPHITAGDLLWIVGIRQTAEAITAASGTPAPSWYSGDSANIWEILPKETRGDFVFTCPPYADLEEYSDDHRDISAADYITFADTYGRIVRKTIALLRENRFAAFVVGDIRDQHGHLRNFPGLTIDAAEAAGAKLYNEAILITPAGTLPIRAGKQFENSRKLGKTHQNLLVFVKGDPAKATEAAGTIAMG